MELFLQVLAGVLLTVVLGIALGKQNKDMSMVLTLAVCCMVLAAAISYLRPVIEFVQQLEVLGGLDSEMLQIMLKAVGIGLISQIAVLICGDCGNAALGKTIQILASAVVLWLSLPLMRALLEMIQKILGDL
jgi:stage III sporulation protein AD